MTACPATSRESGGEPARRSGNAAASRGATAATRRTWWNTRAENSADDSAQSGETKMTAISAIAPQPAPALDERPRPTTKAKAASAAISSGSRFQRAHKSSGTAAGPQYAIRVSGTISPSASWRAVYPDYDERQIESPQKKPQL